MKPTLKVNMTQKSINLTEPQIKHCEEQGNIAAYIRLLINREMKKDN